MARIRRRLFYEMGIGAIAVTGVLMLSAGETTPLDHIVIGVLAFSVALPIARRSAQLYPRGVNLTEYLATVVAGGAIWVFLLGIAATPLVHSDVTQMFLSVGMLFVLLAVPAIVLLLWSHGRSIKTLG